MVVLIVSLLVISLYFILMNLRTKQLKKGLEIGTDYSGKEVVSLILDDEHMVGFSLESGYSKVDPEYDVKNKTLKISDMLYDYTTMLGYVVCIFKLFYAKRSKNAKEAKKIEYYEAKTKLLLLSIIGIFLFSIEFLGTFLNLTGLLIIASVAGLYVTKAFIELLVKKDVEEFIKDRKLLEESEEEDFLHLLKWYMSESYIMIGILLLLVLSRGISSLII